MRTAWIGERLVLERMKLNLGSERQICAVSSSIFENIFLDCDGSSGAIRNSVGVLKLGSRYRRRAARKACNWASSSGSRLRMIGESGKDVDWEADEEGMKSTKGGSRTTGTVDDRLLTLLILCMLLSPPIPYSRR